MAKTHLEEIERDAARLVKHIVDRAVQKDTPFTEATDALKQVTAYYAAQLKRKVGPEEDTPEQNFGNFAEQVHGADAKEHANGRKVRVSNRRGSN